MSKDPRSYRVPVLRLSDVYTDDEGGEQPQDDVMETQTPPAAPPPQSTAPKFLDAAPGKKPVHPPMSTPVPQTPPAPRPTPAPPPVQTETVAPIPPPADVQREVPVAPPQPEPVTVQKPEPVQNEPRPAPPPLPPVVPHETPKVEPVVVASPPPPPLQEQPAPAFDVPQFVAPSFTPPPSPVPPQQVRLRTNPDAEPFEPIIMVAPQTPPAEPASPKAPLPKPKDPFEVERAPDPLDIWESAAMKKAPPVIPKRKPAAPPVPPQPVPAITPPQNEVREQPLPVYEMPDLAPTPVQAIPIRREPVATQVPAPIAETVPPQTFVPPSPPVPTPPPVEAPTPPDPKEQANLLERALAGMGFGSPAPVPPPAPAPAHMSAADTAQDITHVAIQNMEVPASPAPQPAQSVAPPKPSLGIGNLAALRNRVLRSGAHAQKSTPDNIEKKEGAQSAAAEVPVPETVIHEEVRHIEKPAGERVERRLEHTRIDATGMPFDIWEASDKHAPETKHAKAIADVANALHSIREGKTPAPSTPPPIPSASPAPEGPTLVVGQPYEAVAPQQPPAQEVPPPPQGVPMIRTFKGDVERTMNKDRVSVVKMISDQEKYRVGGGDTKVHRTPKKYLSVRTMALLVGAAVLFVAAIVIGVILINTLFRTTVSDTANTLFFADETIPYNVTGQDRTDILQGLTRKRDALTLAYGSIAEITPVEDVTVADIDTTQTRSIPGREFLERINVRAPSTLLRTVQDSFIIGIHADADNEPFMVLRAGFYANAFSGMLLWEETIDVDLAPFFGAPLSLENVSPVPQPAATTSSSTASTTVPLEPDPTTVDTRDLGTFDDVTISNVKVRALKNEYGDIKLLWSMPDDSTIIITTNMETLREITDRMSGR